MGISRLLDLVRVLVSHHDFLLEGVQRAVLVGYGGHGGRFGGGLWQLHPCKGFWYLMMFLDS